MDPIPLSPGAVSTPASGRGLVAATVLFCALFIVLTWTVTRILVNEEKREALDRSVAESKTIAAIVAANTAELLGRGIMYARLSRPLLSHPGAGAAFVRPSALGDTAYLRHAIFRADGTPVHPSSAHPDPVLRALAARLLSARSDATAGEPVLIGIPVDPELGGFWGIPLAAVVQSDRGRTEGVFAAYIDLGYLLGLYRDINLRAGSTIEIQHADGGAIAELHDGMLVAGSRGFQGTNATENRDDGFIVIRDGYSGSGPVGAVRPLERFPVSVSVRREAGAVLAAIEPRHRGYYLRAMLASLGLLSLGWWLVRLARRQQTLYEDLSRSEQRNRVLIEQLESEKSRAVALASQDFLTQLPNRMMFHQLAAAELARARRRPRQCALYFLDLDKFKAINDSLGHAVGDLLLKAVGARLRASLRAYDLIARLGGDEFVVLVSELESTQRAAAIAQKLIHALSAPYPDLAGHRVETSPSIGIALFPADGKDIDALLSAADLAMYHAKRSGRGTYRFHDSALNTTATRRLELVSHMRPAVRGNQFHLHYQMRVSLEDYAPVGLEALLRWEHPAHGNIPPGEFIPLAEEYDVIDVLGQWTVDAACAQLARWRADGVPLLPVAINVSARQLRDSSLVDIVAAALRRHEIHPGLIEVEVTESCFIERPEVARHVLDGLHRLGIRIALDDYGTGFSGLSHLKQLPIRTIKIDRSFIQDIRNDTSDAMIVASTISLSHSLGLRVVAEGVETREQLVHLKAAGCDEVQGYFFHRPADGASVAASLRERSMQPAPRSRP